MEYLNYPKGFKGRKWPTDIAANDTEYIRMYIKWRYPEAFKPELLPVATHKQLVDFLTDKGYSFGLPYYVGKQTNDGK